jgi:hypothetical protein
LRCGAVIFPPMLDFPVFVIGRQPAKIRRHRLRFVRLRCRLRQPRRVLAVKKTSLYSGDRVSQQPAPASCASLLGLLRGESPDEIGAAEDADDPTVAHHRYTLNAVSRQLPDP